LHYISLADWWCHIVTKLCKCGTSLSQCTACCTASIFFRNALLLKAEFVSILTVKQFEGQIVSDQNSTLKLKAAADCSRIVKHSKLCMITFLAFKYILRGSDQFHLVKLNSYCIN